MTCDHAMAITMTHDQMIVSTEKKIRQTTFSHELNSSGVGNHDLSTNKQQKNKMAIRCVNNYEQAK